MKSLTTAKLAPFAAAAALLATGCGTGQPAAGTAVEAMPVVAGPAVAPAQVPDPAPAGLVTLASPLSVEETVANLVEALEANDAIMVVAQVDHAANAAGVGLELPPTVEVIFGNPSLGTPLMQATRSVGIDLPQKILVYQSADGSTVIAYNSPDYLASRHSLTGVDEQLTMIDGALAMLAAKAAGDETLTPNEPATATVANRQGLVTRTTTGTAADAVARLVAAINGNDDLILVAQVDHAANADGVGLELPPTVEVIFGNPNLGTPLMQAQRTVAIDLPQKLLIAEEDGQVTITYNDPAYLAARHGIDADTPEVATIIGALDMLSSAALAPEEEEMTTTTSTTTTTTTVAPTEVTLPETR